MRSIKQKLLVPLLSVIVLTPMITILVYNIIFTRYFEQNTRTQLLFSVEASHTLVKKEAAGLVYETDPESIRRILTNLNRILGNTVTILNLELVLIGENGEILYLTDRDPKLLNEDLIRQITARLNDLSTTDVLRFYSDHRHIAVAGYRLTQLPISDIPYVVYVSSMDEAKPILLQGNLILISIMLIAGTLGIVMVVRISDKVIRPVKELSKGARDISLQKPFTPVTGSDVLEMVTLSDNMAEMDARLKEYDRAQKAFLQDASHELKTPLMSIQGYAEGIEKGLFSDTREAARVIVRESKRLGEILSELLTLSRIDNLNYSFLLEPVLLHELLKDSVQHFNGIALKAGKRVILDTIPERVTILCNDELFRQCFGNIVDNAIRYAKKTVRIRVSEAETDILIHIEDDGEGISEKDIGNLFKRFYKGEGGQHGLGLAIAQKAAHEMGWEIEASNTGHGACFTIRLPGRLQTDTHS